MVLAPPRRLRCHKCLRCPSPMQGTLGREGQLSRRHRQSRAMSLVEAATNVVVGFLLALATQFAVFPWLGLTVSMTDNLLIGSVFTVISIVRSYMLRRLFEVIPGWLGRR